MATESLFGNFGRRNDGVPSFQCLTAGESKFCAGIGIINEGKRMLEGVILMVL